MDATRSACLWRVVRLCQPPYPRHAQHCDEIGLGYSCSVWDTTSAKEIVSLNPDLIKVGSPSNQHWEMQKVRASMHRARLRVPLEHAPARWRACHRFAHLLAARRHVCPPCVLPSCAFRRLAWPHLSPPLAQVLRDEYSGDVHISTGMTTKEEIEKIVQFWEEGKGNAKKRLVLYNCTSGYPVPFDNVCLLELRELHDKYVDRVQAIGFSGHHLGIAVDVAAYAMGATWNERHFTKDRTWKGTDHAASLEPAGLQKLCRDLKATWKCMTYKSEEILPIEKEQRAKLKWGCYNAAEVKK